MSSGWKLYETSDSKILFSKIIQQIHKMKTKQNKAKIKSSNKSIWNSVNSVKSVKSIKVYESVMCCLPFLRLCLGANKQVGEITRYKYDNKVFYLQGVSARSPREVERCNNWVQIIILTREFSRRPELKLWGL